MDKNRFKQLKMLKIWISTLALTLLALLFLSGYIFLPKDWHVMLNLCLTLFTTLVSIVIITITYTVWTEIELKETIRDVIIESLSGDDKILGKYHNNGIVGIVKNSLGILLGEDLSRKFIVNVLDKQLGAISYRTGFNYEVMVDTIDDQDSSIYNDCERISQTLEYRKHIKHLSSSHQELEFSCHFSYKKDPFRNASQNDIVFFREELSCEKFFNTLLQYNENGEFNRIIESLGFTICFNNEEGSKFRVDPNQIRVEVTEDRKLIILTTTIPDNFVKKEADEFISFHAEIICEYPTNKNSCFYFAIIEPTQVGTFRITFDKAFAKEKIQKVSFISSPYYEIVEMKKINAFEFKLKKSNYINIPEYNTIFPHSGIIFYW